MSDEPVNQETEEPGEPRAPQRGELNVTPRDIEEEMQSSYIDYAMSVIVGRALPDVRDGLKPVHRRILYAMLDLGLAHNKPYKKSARVVGEVLGKYHPHGDVAVYDAMVRMVQEFSLRYPLVDGQGNFGSVDGDPPAAMRYTEVRLAALAEEMLADIDKETVPFTANFDGSLTEPALLPSAIPNLLVNGSSGIAVGMATNIPPHNLGEVVDGLTLLIDQPQVDIKELMKVVKGPDFPTGATICGREGIRDAYQTGRGSIMVRAKMEVEELKGGRSALIVTEIPYQVNKADLLIRIADLVRDKQLDGVSDIRDESDREGIRVVIELKRDAIPDIVTNQLYHHTALQSSFGVIMLALVNSRPKVLNLKEALEQYLLHRQEVVTRRTRYDLQKAEARAHILEGLRIALENLTRIVKLIRESRDVEAARAALIREFKLTRVQAQAILDMRLHQLTGLEREAIEKEYRELTKEIERLKAILADPRKVLGVVREELVAVKDKYGDARRTRIAAAAEDMEIEDLIQEEEVAVTMSQAGYVKRIPLGTYRAQNRGGKGITGMTTREEDFVVDVFVTSTHSFLLLFTNRGRVYWLKVYEIPEAGRAAKGKALVNLVRLTSADEKVTAAIPIRDFSHNGHGQLIMLTRLGIIKRTALAEYANPRPSGIIAIKLEEGDSLIEVKSAEPGDQVMLATRQGLAVCCSVDEVREIGRVGRGVRGIRLREGDEVVGMELAGPKDTILTATVNGYGKRSKVSDYRVSHRGTLGVKNIKTTDRNGTVVGIKRIGDADDLMMMTAKGKAIRVPAKTIRVMGRATQGVRLVRLEEGDTLAAIARIVPEEEKEAG